MSHPHLGFYNGLRSGSRQSHHAMCCDQQTQTPESIEHETRPSRTTFRLNLQNAPSFNLNLRFLGSRRKTGLTTKTVATEQKATKVGLHARTYELFTYEYLCKIINSLWRRSLGSYFSCLLSAGRLSSFSTLWWPCYRIAGFPTTWQTFACGSATARLQLIQSFTPSLIRLFVKRLFVCSSVIVKGKPLMYAFSSSH